MKHKLWMIACVAIAVQATAQERISLEQVVTLSLEKNYDVRLAKNSAVVASTNYDYTIGAFLPQINGTAARLWNTNDQKQRLADNSERGGDGIRTNNLNASLQLVWTLFDGTKMFATRERIEQIAEQGDILVKNQIVNTIASVILNYFNIVKQKQQLKAIQEQMAVSEERVKLAERKLDVGVGGKPELLQAKVDLNAQRTQVLLQEAAIYQLKQQLNGLVDMKLPQEYDVADTILINLNLQKQEVANNIENTNYSLMAARRNVDIANLVLRERRTERSPIINFNSNYNFSRVENMVAVNNFTLLFNQNRGFNYGFSVTVPILNGLNTNRLIRQARLSVYQQELLYQQEKTLTDIGVQNAFVNYENALKVLLIEEENILLAKENVFIALEGFKRGVTTFIELRTAQQSLEEAYNRLITARYNAKLSETELLRLNGSLLK